MKLPFLSFLQKKPPTEYFLALLLRDEKIHAVVFEQVNGRIQVIGEGKATLSTSIETISDEALLDSSDKAISIAEEALPDGIQTHKTVFGVKETWVEDTHITKDYLAKLKKVAEQLDLQPIGFLVFPEAIAHLLQKEDGAPVSAILIDVGERHITMTLIRAGRIVETKEVPVSEDITSAVENGLKEFENVEIFPSRLILFDKGDASMERKFLSHHWSKSLPFLHVPQVTTLAHDFDTRAILFGTATQMGLDAIDLVKSSSTKKEPFFEEDAKEEKEIEDTPVKKAIEVEEAIDEPTEEEIKAQENHKEQPEEDMYEVSGKDTTEYFGFVKGADVGEAAGHVHKTPIPEGNIDEVTAEIPEREREKEEAGDSAYGFGASGPMFFEGAKKIFASIRSRVPKQVSLGAFAPAFEGIQDRLPVKGAAIFFIPGGILLLLILFVWYIFGLHATATLILLPKIITQDQSVTFSTNSQTNPNTNTIGAESVSVTEEGKVSGDATGNKDVGDKAKGTVTVFNNDDQPHTVSSGTVITATSGQKFSLDKDVSVASASGDIFSGTKPGTADVSVTATDIGTDSNLPSNTKFTISGTSVLAAKNASAFSGGTKKSIVVVTQKDLDNVVDQLTSNLKDKAKSDLANKVSGDKVILPEFTDTTAVVKNFDKKVGDEASSINLDGSISYETIFYKKSDIEAFAKSALQGKLSSDLVLSSDGITYSVKDLTVKDGDAKATLSMKASLIPNLDTKSLKDKIAGKSFSDARGILSSVPQFSDSTFTLSPNLFFLPKTLPRISGNITLTITTHE